MKCAAAFSFLLLVANLLPIPLSAQTSDKQVDSLLNVLKVAKEDSGKVNTLNRLGSQLSRKKDKTESIQYHQQAVSLAQILSYKKGEGDALSYLGNIYNEQNLYEEALKSFHRAMSLYQEIHAQKDIAKTFGNIGTVKKNQGNFEEALENHLAALKTLNGIDDKDAIATTYLNIGITYKHLGNFPEALKNFQLSLKLDEETGNRQQMAANYLNMGQIYRRQSNYPEALKNLLSALRIQEELKNKRGMANAYLSIGNVYIEQDNEDEALNYFHSALAIYEELGMPSAIADTYNNIGNIQRRQHNYPEALKSIQSSLRINESAGNKEGIASGNYSIGNIYMEMDNSADALNSYRAALKYGEEMGSKEMIMDCNRAIGIALLNQSAQLQNDTLSKMKVEESVPYLSKALSMARELQEVDMIQLSYGSLSEAYKMLGNYEQALEYVSEGNIYKDSIRNDEVSRQLEQLRTQYEVEKAVNEEKAQQELILAQNNAQHQIELTRQNAKKEQALADQEFQNENLRSVENSKHQLALANEQYESSKKDHQIELLNKEKDFQALSLVKQKQSKIYFLTAMILLVILSVFIYRNYRSRQEVKMLALRNKIASDLHDDVGSTLSSISMFSQMAQAQSKEVMPALDIISESSRKMLDAMNDIVWTINPENDQFEKIIMRMRSFAFELLGAKDIEFEFYVDEEVSKIKLPMEARKNLFLIFKETTNNMVKYAGADKAMFSIKAKKDMLTMLIRDNGKGFDTKIEFSGNGLKNIRKRAHEIGAALTIDSMPGNGTTVQLDLALSA